MTYSRSDLERAAKRLIERWAPDPVLFAQEVFGVDLWSRQAEVARSVATRKRTACKSGHKIGKSTLAAILAIWWALTRERGRTIITAPAGHQIRNIIWPEITRLYRQEARAPIGGRLYNDPGEGLKLPGNRSIICVTTDEGEKLAGLSGPNQLFIVDEASGFDERLWAPIYGNLAGGGRLLALGNPTQTSGHFYEAFTSKSELWARHTISSAEGPNVVAGRTVVPGLAEREWVIEMLLEHAGIRLDADASYEDVMEALQSVGDEAPFLNVRVLGLHASQAENAIIGLSLVDLAQGRWESTAADGEACIGVDVARFGDDESVLAPRRGQKIRPLQAFRNLDGPQLADRVIEAANALREFPEEMIAVNVDVIGVGASCYDSLTHRAKELNLDVHDINTGEAADDPGKYRNLRAQLHFGFRTWLREGGAIPRDEKLSAELVATTYSLDELGRYVVEKKEEIKKRLKRSPDRADAVQLSVYRKQVRAIRNAYSAARAHRAGMPRARD